MIYRQRSFSAVVVLCAAVSSATAQAPLLSSSTAGPQRARSAVGSSALPRLHGAALVRDTTSKVPRRTYAGTGAVLGALVGGLLAAESCQRNDCYVPLIPVALLAGVGGAVGGLVGIFIDR
mgnify:CR=1 FL=1